MKYVFALSIVFLVNCSNPSSPSLQEVSPAKPSAQQWFLSHYSRVIDKETGVVCFIRNFSGELACAQINSWIK